MERMTDAQAVEVLLKADAKLLRFWRLPDAEAAHIERKDPSGFGDWSRISRGKHGATLRPCVDWLKGESATVDAYVRDVLDKRKGGREPLPAPASVLPGIGVQPASIGKVVVDVDPASKAKLKTMKAPERQRRSIEGHKAVVARLGEPDGVQRSPSGGLHLYYPAEGIPEELTRNATWAVEAAKVGGDIRGSNGWAGVYDLPRLAAMVLKGHGAALDVAAFKAFCNNPHEKAGRREAQEARLKVYAKGGTAAAAEVAAACEAIRSAEAGDTHAGRNPTIVYHVARLAKEKMLDEAAEKALLAVVAEVKPGYVEDTERYIEKAREWAEPSRGDTGGPARAGDDGGEWTKEEEHDPAAHWAEYAQEGEGAGRPKKGEKKTSVSETQVSRAGGRPMEAYDDLPVEGEDGAQPEGDGPAQQDRGGAHGESTSGAGGGGPPPDDVGEGVTALLAQWQGWKDGAKAKPPPTLTALKREAPALLRQIVRGVTGGTAGEPRDAEATLDALQQAFAAGGDDAVKAALDAGGWLTPPAKPRQAKPVAQVTKARPAPLLRLENSKGAVLSIGTVGVLSGAGGMGKSALTASLALSLAARGDNDPGTLTGGMFSAPEGGGAVLMATYEDAPAVTRWRIEKAAELLNLVVTPGRRTPGHLYEVQPATDRVFLMDMAGAPLYGPRAGEGEDGRPGLYNARPEPLPGWDDLWREVERIGKPKEKGGTGSPVRLVVIDPVLAAFVGHSNEAAQVREFLSALAVTAERHGCAVLLVAHSTKEARGKGGQNARPNPFDPGQVGGSAAWTDGVRSALVLGWDDARGPGMVQLAIAKSNYGPARQLLPLERLKVEGGDDGGATVAFRGQGDWIDHGSAGDPERWSRALMDGIVEFRGRHPGADLGGIFRVLGVTKGLLDKARKLAAAAANDAPAYTPADPDADDERVI